MSKKVLYISIAAGVTILVLGAGGGAYYWQKQSTDIAQQPQAAQEVDTTGSNTPLELQEAAGSSSPSSLRVDNSTNNDANVQGQISTQAPTSAATPKQPPGPETFQEYDKYKDGTTALFGELVAGTGAEVGANSKVAVYYKGWLTNGTLFDQSRNDPKTNQLQPFVFQMGAQSVITGWEQGIFGMKVGGTRRLIIPPAVGYGATGQGPIPGNAVLVFDVQLLEVE